VRRVEKRGMKEGEIKIKIRIRIKIRRGKEDGLERDKKDQKDQRDERRGVTEGGEAGPMSVGRAGDGCLSLIKTGEK